MATAQGVPRSLFLLPANVALDMSAQSHSAARPPGSVALSRVLERFLAQTPASTHLLRDYFRRHETKLLRLSQTLADLIAQSNLNPEEIIISEDGMQEEDAAWFVRNRDLLTYLAQALTHELKRQLKAQPPCLPCITDRTQAQRAGLVLRPISLREARAFIAENHRHHRPPQGAKLALGVACGDRLVGVATVGRPVARHLDNGQTAEVTRVATDGTCNAPSMLLGAAWRAAKALGYRRLVTYTLPSESGASLRAAGWRLDGRAKGGSWSSRERPRDDDHPLGEKLRWTIGEP